MDVFQDRKDHELYLRLVDCVILGPAPISQTEAEAGMGIDSWYYSSSVQRRPDTLSQSEECERSDWRQEERTQSSPEPKRSVRLVEPDKPHERLQRKLMSSGQCHDWKQRQSPEPKFVRNQGIYVHYTKDAYYVSSHHPSCLLQSGSRGQPQGIHRPQRDQSSDKTSSRWSSTSARGLRDDWKCPDLHSQFELFSKFANAGSDGTTITLRKRLSF